MPDALLIKKATEKREVITFPFLQCHISHYRMSSFYLQAVKDCKGQGVSILRVSKKRVFSPLKPHRRKKEKVGREE